MSILWLAAFCLFLVVEGLTVSLVSIWFAGGSLAALMVEVCGGGLEFQLGAFVLVSALLFLMVRPFASKYVQRKHTKTNVDSFVGRKVVVKERIDNAAGTGTAILAGGTWLARAAQENQVFDANTVVVVTGVKGAKLLVEAEKE